MDGRVTLQKLELFVSVVDLGSVSRAADRAYLAQPVVSGHMRDLEQRVGARLLTRQNGRMVPTAEGRRVYGWASELLIKGRELSRELAGRVHGEQGEAVIAAGMSFGSYVLPRILQEFMADRPLAQVTVTISNPEVALTSLHEGRCDFAVILGDELDHRSRIASELLYEEEVVLVTAPDDPVQVRPLESLRDAVFVCSPKHSYRRGIIDRLLAEHGVDRKAVSLELEHPEAIKRVVGSGYGVAMLLRSSVEEDLETCRLQAVSLPEADFRARTYLCREVNKVFSPMQQALVDQIQLRCRDRRRP